MRVARNMIWVQVKKPITLKQDEKAKIERFVADFIEKTAKLKKNLSRILIRGGRIYVYKLYEPVPPGVEGVEFTRPLIDGKYLEFPYFRITIYNRNHTECTLDFQRHNDQWMTIDKGTLEECLIKAEESDWFD
jgi:hypothetical protein